MGELSCRLVSQSGDATQTNVFDLTKRGYNPNQVDGHVQALLARVEMLEHAHRQEQQRADDAEAELTRSRARPSGDAEHGDAVQQGFGHRIERVLRVAEQEAANARATASREAAALMERTRREAETHRQEVEHNLAARRKALDDEAARRRGELDERERELDEQAAAAREEAEQTLAEARMGAEQITRDAEAESQRRRDDTESIIRRRHTEAENELQRLSGLHDGVRNDLGRLLESLSGQLPGRQAGRHLAAANAEFQGDESDDPQDQRVHAEHGAQPGGADAS
jgi:chromosome segregation ATPase